MPACCNACLLPRLPALQVMAEVIKAARPHELARMRMDENLVGSWVAEGGRGGRW